MTWLLLFIVLLTVLLAVWQTVQIGRLRQRVEAVPAEGGVFAAMHDLDDRMADTEDLVAELSPRVEALEVRMPLAISHTGVVAYDAFGDISGNLSRSIALVNDEGDGVVISLLVARNETLFFTKEIRAGRGLEALSPEEQRAVARALGQ